MQYQLIHSQITTHFNSPIFIFTFDVHQFIDFYRMKQDLHNAK